MTLNYSIGPSHEDALMHHGVITPLGVDTAVLLVAGGVDGYVKQAAQAQRIMRACGSCLSIAGVNASATWDEYMDTAGAIDWKACEDNCCATPDMVYLFPPL